MAMTKKLKDKWIKALKSGKYKQGKDYLRFDDERGSEYCCLGVLCEVSKLNKSNGKTGYIFPHDCLLVENEYELPRCFADKIGITGNQQKRLVDLNDSKEKDFKEIAEWIEKNIRVKKEKVCV